jgi:hypothetical protein
MLALENLTVSKPGICSGIFITLHQSRITNDVGKHNCCKLPCVNFVHSVLLRIKIRKSALWFLRFKKNIFISR